MTRCAPCLSCGVGVRGVIYSAVDEPVIMSDSLSLALMVLTFLVPLVLYFGTSAVSKEQEQENGVNLEKEEKETFIKKSKGDIHPVLRQNCAIARLVTQQDILAGLAAQR